MLNKLLQPIKAIKLRYLPLLSIFFAIGFEAISNVAGTLFTKNNITLSASELISLGIWTQLPWSIKMVFGSFIDGVRIFGSNRKAYIYLGDFLFLLSVVGLVDHASSQYLIHSLGQYGGLLATGLLGTIGIVTSQIVANTMAVEVVDKTGDVAKELGTIQVLARLAMVVGSLGAAFLSGWLAANFSTAFVFGLTAVCPLISILSTFLIKLEPVEHNTKLNIPLLASGSLYALLCVLSGLLLGEHAQLTVFIISMLIISGMMAYNLKTLPKEVRFGFVMSMAAIFLFRTTPGAGPGLSWFYIDKLGFDAQFLGNLKVVESLTSLGILWFSMEYMAKANISKVLTILTILVTILSLPDIMVYYNIHSYLGISARHLILVDSAAVTAISQLSMIPLGVIIAKNAPSSERAMYISLTASLMNIALVLGDLITKWLNDIFIVTRTDFSQLGQLLIWSLIISTGLSIIGLAVLQFNKE